MQACVMLLMRQVSAVHAFASYFVVHIVTVTTINMCCLLRFMCVVCNALHIAHGSPRSHPSRALVGRIVRECNAPSLHIQCKCAESFVCISVYV